MPDVFGASGQFGIDALNAQNQNALNNAYGPQGFGGQTADYSAAGAAYGRATGGFNASQPSVFDTGTSGIQYLPGGGIDQNNASNIAYYYKMMGGGGGGGGYSPYNPQTYAPQQPSWMSAPQSQNSGGGTWYDSSWRPQGADSWGGGLSYLPGGGLNQNDPGNIAYYNRMMGGGGGAYPANFMSPPALGALGPPPDPMSGFNIDPRFEFKPSAGTENSNMNILDPDDVMRASPQYDPQQAQRDRIAQILLQSTQAARS